MNIMTATDGSRFALLDDAPDVLVPIDEETFRDVLGDGFAASNALKYAVDAPYRVTWGFGAFENFASLEGALAYANDLADRWLVHNGRVGTYAPAGTPADQLRYDICGPDVLRRRSDEEVEAERAERGPDEYVETFTTVHRPTHGEFYAEPVPAMIRLVGAVDNVEPVEVF